MNYITAAEWLAKYGSPNQQGNNNQSALTDRDEE
jgi:hypothetical protein